MRAWWTAQIRLFRSELLASLTQTIESSDEDWELESRRMDAFLRRYSRPLLTLVWPAIGVWSLLASNVAWGGAWSATPTIDGKGSEKCATS